MNSFIANRSQRHKSLRTTTLPVPGSQSVLTNFGRSSFSKQSTAYNTLSPSSWVNSSDAEPRRHVESFPDMPTTRRCYRCGVYGHIARYCSEPQLSKPGIEHPHSTCSADANTSYHQQNPNLAPASHLSLHAAQAGYPNYDVPSSAWTEPSSMDQIQHSSVHTSPHSQSYSQCGLPTPGFLDIFNTSLISQAEEFWAEKAFPPVQSRNGTDSISQQYAMKLIGGNEDLLALDFPEHCTSPGAFTFPTKSIAEPLPASMEVADVLCPLPFPSTIPPRACVSTHFRMLDDVTYYQNISKQSAWGDFCNDPVFAFFNTSSTVIGFAELYFRRDSLSAVEFDDDPSVPSKFDIACLYQEPGIPDPNVLSPEQEAKLAALGVSGPVTPTLRAEQEAKLAILGVSGPENEHSVHSLAAVPPWRANDNSQFSRIFSGPGHTQPLPHPRISSIEDSVPYIESYTDLTFPISANGETPCEHSSPAEFHPQVVNPRKRPHASDYFDDTALPTPHAPVKVRRSTFSNPNITSSETHDTSIFKRRWSDRQPAETTMGDYIKQ